MTKEWRKKNREHLNEYRNEWAKQNRDKINKQRKEWIKNNPEKKKAQHKKYNTSLKGRFNTSKGAAKRRNKTFTLSFEEFCKVISEPCIYCNNELGNKSKTGSGLDRLDNAIGYELSNVQSCCKYCNQIKGEILTVEETKAAVKAILKVRGIICD